MSEVWSAVCRKAALVAVALAFVATASALAVDYPLPSDQDRDGVVDDAESAGRSPATSRAVAPASSMPLYVGGGA